MADEQHPIDRAAAIVGSQTALAALLGVTKAAVGQWKDDGRRVPAEHCPEIERLTGGAVRCEDLRPDVAWKVLREPTDTAAQPKQEPSEAPVAANGDEGQPHTALSMGEDARSPERDDSPEADESYRRWRAKRSEKPQ